MVMAAAAVVLVAVVAIALCAILPPILTTHTPHTYTHPRANTTLKQGLPTIMSHRRNYNQTVGTTSPYPPKKETGPWGAVRACVWWVVLCRLGHAGDETFTPMCHTMHRALLLLRWSCFQAAGHPSRPPR